MVNFSVPYTEEFDARFVPAPPKEERVSLSSFAAAVQARVELGWDGQGIPGGILSVSTGTIPGVELPIAACLWFNQSKREYWTSFDVMFGANVLDETAGVLIKSA